MKHVLVVLSIILLASFASASTVDFVGYPSYNVDQPVISYQGLTFTGTGIFQYVWCCNSPNAGTAPGLIFAGFGNGGTMTMTKTGGGAFTLNSVDMTLSWYDTTNASRDHHGQRSVEFNLVSGASDLQPESHQHIVHFLRCT